MAEEPKPEAAAPKKKPSGRLLAIAAGVLLCVGLGGTVLLRHRSAAAQSNPEDGAKTEVRSVLHLESFVVNLQGATENGYLRIGVDLGLGVELKDGENKVASVGRLRDAILTELGTRTVEELLTPAGKAKLKEDIVRTINDRVPEVQCQEVYFTEFLVQH